MQREGVHRRLMGGQQWDSGMTGAAVGWGGATVGGRFLTALYQYSLNEVQGLGLGRGRW